MNACTTDFSFMKVFCGTGTQRDMSLVFLCREAVHSHSLLCKTISLIQRAIVIQILSNIKRVEQLDFCGVHLAKGIAEFGRVYNNVMKTRTTLRNAWKDQSRHDGQRKSTAIDFPNISNRFEHTV